MINKQHYQVTFKHFKQNLALIDEQTKKFKKLSSAIAYAESVLGNEQFEQINQSQEIILTTFYDNDEELIKKQVIIKNYPK